MQYSAPIAHVVLDIGRTSHMQLVAGFVLLSYFMFSSSSLSLNYASVYVFSENAC